MAELRCKAARYDKIKEQLLGWRAKAARYDRVVSELARRKRRAALALLALRRVTDLRMLALPPLAGASTPPGLAPSSRTVISAQKRHICILSRKNLRDITRVPRMAKALVDAGFAVTVVALRAPVRQLQEMCPEVEYLSVAPRPITAWRLGRARRPAIASATPESGGAPGPPRRRRRSALFPLFGLAAAARRLLIAAPLVLVLKKSEEGFLAAWHRAADDSTLTLLGRLVGQLHQRAMTHAFAKEADKATRARRFDVVQAHDNYALVAAARLARRHRAKLVYDAVELSSHRLALDLSRLEALREWCERREEAAIFRKADQMLAVGDGVASWYARTYAIERPLVVRNCRYFWNYRSDGRLRADAGVDQAVPVIVWSGSAYPQQGLELLIEAVPSMAPQIHVAIVATALPRWALYVSDELPRYAAARGVADRVHFLPARQPNDLVAYVSGADLGVIPRPREHLNNFFSMPNKFLEMVMARLPVAVSRVGDMVEAIEAHRIGDVFDERNPEDIAAVIERMLVPATYRRLKSNVMAAAEEMCWESESALYVAAIRALVPAPAEPRAAVIAVSDQIAPRSPPPKPSPIKGEGLYRHSDLSSRPLDGGGSGWG